MKLRSFSLVLIAIFLSAPRAISQDSVAVRDSSLIKASLAEAVSHINTAYQFFKKKRPEDAFAQLFIAQSLYQQSANNTGQANVLQVFGDYYTSNYVWKKAEVSYLRALRLARTDDYELKGNICAKLADSYLRQQNIESAAKYYTAAINQFDKADLIAKSAINYVNLAEVRRQQKRFQDAEFMIMKRALPLFRSAGYVQGRIGSFDVLGHLYHDQKRYSEAKWYYIQANMLARTLKDTVAITESLVNLGNVKVSIGDYKLALKDFNEAQALSKKHALLKQQRDLSNAFSRLYTKTGNKGASASSLERYAKLNDSMNSVEQRKISTASQTKPTAMPEKEKPSIIAKIAKSTDVPWGILSVLGVAAAMLAWRYFRRKKAS